MILGSIITSIISPFANIFGQVLAFFYSFTHSYGLSIILLTLATMILVFPLTRAGTRSMLRMQIVQPELMKIRNKYKVQPGMSSEERQAARVKLNEEMMALYRENGINPTGGCLPMFMQFPIFIVLYDTIRGMTRTVTRGTGKAAHSVLSPQFIPKDSALYRAVIHAHGVLSFIGLNLTDSVRTHGSFAHKVPYILVILLAVVLQYVSIWQITTRNPSASQAPAQMQAMQKFMPLIFVVIYIFLPAGVGVYFIVSSLFRVGQQEYMYKHDPRIKEAAAEIRKRRGSEPPKPPAKALAAASPRASTVPEAANGSKKGFRERLRDAAAGFQGNLPDAPDGRTGNGAAPPAKAGARSGPARKQAPPAPRPSPNRSKDKRRRRT